MIDTQWKQQHQEIADETTSHIIDKLPKQKVLVRGVTIDFSIPAGNNLTLRGTKPIEGNDIKEDISISIVPPRIRYKFNNLRRKFYSQILKDIAFTLGKGEGKRNLYLIPFENISLFEEAIKELNEEFKELEEEINQYFNKQTTSEEREYLENVTDHVQNHQEIYHATVPTIYKVHLEIDYELMPLRIDTATFKEIAADQVTQAMEKSLTYLEVEFAKSRKRIIERMVADLHLRFSTILRKLSKAAVTSYTFQYGPIESAVDQTINLAKTANLDWIIKDLAEAVKATAKVLKEKDFDKEELENATFLIATALDLPTTDQPGKILEKATFNLGSMNERTRALIERM